MSHEEQKLNRKFEASERTQSPEKTVVDATISTRAEQVEAHRAAHEGDTTLSDTSLKAITSGNALNLDYEPLMLIDLDADGRVRPLATSEAPASFIDLKALEMEASSNPAFEPVVELKRFARTLPQGQEKTDLYQLAQDLAKSLRAKELSPDSNQSQEASDRLPAITPTFNLSATKIEYVREISTTNFDTFHPERLADFARIAAGKAIDFLTDEQALDQLVEDEREKFIGIGEGLNEAKENVKALARSGWTGVTDGTALRMMLKACDIGYDLELVLGTACAVGSWLYNEMPHLGESIAKSSDRYSHMSKREQGRVIGNAMFDFLNVDAAVEFPHLFSKGLKQEIANEKAVDNILQVLVASASDKAGQLGIKRLRTVLSVAKEVITSPEFHKILTDSVLELAQTGPRRILAPAGGPFDEHFLMMMGSGSGGGGFFDKARKLYQEVGERLRPEKLLTSQELRELEETIAKEKITSRIVDKVAEGTEHHIRCRQAVFDLPLEDLIALYIREHRFFFPETLESIFKREAKMSAELLANKEILCENLAGATMRIGEKTLSVIPEKFVDFEKKVLILNSQVHSIEGLVRHEASQQLEEIYNWLSVNLLYKSEKHVLKNEILRLQQMYVTNTDPKLKDLIMYLSRYLDNQTGFEQTISDLYSIAHGGSPKPEIDDMLVTSFKSLAKTMQDKKWLRRN